MRTRYSGLKKVFIILGAIFSIANSVVSGTIIQRMQYLSVGNVSIPSSSLNGTLQGFGALICIAMVLLDYQFGFILAVSCIAFSLFGTLRAIIGFRNLTPLPGAINCILYIIALVLISSQLRKSRKAELTDKLTGQINRYGFEEIIHKKIRAFEKGSIIFIHLQGLTDININLGRNRGDYILKTISSRIDRIINGVGESYKLEGAEFAIFVREGHDCEDLVLKLINSIEEKIEMEGDDNNFNVYVTCKAGIADCINRYVNPDTLMKNADIAMNHAIRSEDMKYCFFNDRIKRQAEREHDVEGFVKEALENGYFYLVYQPQFRIKDKSLRGFESLIRMKLPDGTFVSPAEFIAVAERSDLILRIDAFVLRRAMEEFKEICEKYDYKVVLSINISAKDIAIEGFADTVLQVIEETKFPKKCLELEITEYSFAKSGDKTLENIFRLRDENIMFAIDDFGTGYTSLAQLLNLPANLLKIDKSLIDNICTDETNRDFVNAVIYMGHLMNCEVISEGVEDEDQLTLLKNLGCDFVQGYVWSKPIDYTSVIETCREYVK
jgi:diguanylate cyclase (GGDEF)-like protein